MNKIVSEHHKENVEQLAELLKKDELTPAELKDVQAFGSVIEEYEDRYMSKLRIV